jgi:hypothetical protein
VNVSAMDKREVWAAMSAAHELLAPLVGQHEPRALAVALAAVLGGMTATLHEAHQLRPTLAESLDVVAAWVTSGAHGQISARSAVQGQGGHA